MNSSKTVNKE